MTQEELYSELNKVNGKLLENFEKAKALYQEIAKKDEQPDEWPKDGDIVFILTENNVIRQRRFDCEGLYFKEILSVGNIFRSYDEAYAEARYRLAYQRCRQYIKDKGWEFTPDWEDGRSKFQPTYLSEIKEFGTWITVTRQILDRKGFIFETQEQCGQFIKDNETDLKIMWGVE